MPCALATLFHSLLPCALPTADSLQAGMPVSVSLTPPAVLTFSAIPLPPGPCACCCPPTAPAPRALCASTCTWTTRSGQVGATQRRRNTKRRDQALCSVLPRQDGEWGVVDVLMPPLTHTCRTHMRLQSPTSVPRCSPPRRDQAGPAPRRPAARPHAVPAAAQPPRLRGTGAGWPRVEWRRRSAAAAGAGGALGGGGRGKGGARHGGREKITVVVVGVQQGRGCYYGA